MVPEAPLERDENGLVRKGEGWYVLNARDAGWREREGLGRWCNLEGDPEWPQLGFQLVVLDPGKPACMYHGESDPEAFLVVSGECVLVVEGEERRLGEWDFLYCPPWTEHVFVGAGEEPCVVVMVGARVPDGGVRYPVSDVAARHGASVEVETPHPSEAYARFVRSVAPYRDGDLPG